jgi:DNA repair photolyase
MRMPAKFQQVNCKSALGNLSVLGTRFWTRHCFDPYINCELNCIYCNTSTIRQTSFQQSSVAVCAKTNAPTVLAHELASLKAKGVVSIGLAMDAYQPLEKDLGLTRQVLEVLKTYNCPFSIGTKSDLVLRDLDIISEASKKLPCCVSLSITTLDENLAKVLEPNASSPKRRLAAVKKLSESGVTTGVWISPILPYITDSDENLMSVIEASVDSGANVILGGALDMRSPLGFLKFLANYRPDLIPNYERLYKRSDGSYEYYPAESYLYALYRRFIRHCRQYGVKNYMPHFYTRTQALLFYLRGLSNGYLSTKEFLPVLNYLSPSQEILQMVNLRFRKTRFNQAFLDVFRYFPH